MDEPESIGALGVAGREHLDNLIFVVNCNLQRLDGPVRGNGKIIQELEAVFRGAGWNVIKVIWGSRWDALLAKDVDGVLLDRMNTTVDGEYQKLAVESGAYIREHFFGPDPRLRKMVEDLSDDELVSLPRGGHDYRKLYAAYKLATEQQGAPTVILAKTIKGWTLGPEIEARNATHQIKKMTKAQLRALRDRLYLTDDIPDARARGRPALHPPGRGLRRHGVPARPRARARRPAPRPGGPARRRPLRPDAKVFEEFAAGSGTQAVSTTMVFARLLRNLVRDPDRRARWSPRSSPTRPAPSGSSRSSPRPRSTRPTGQHYIPVDADLPLHYAESSSGQMLQEGITEAGALASSSRSPPRTPPGASPWSPSTSSIPCSASSGSATWPGRSATCAGAASWPAARPGAPPCMGEGLQHDDGHSPLLASTNPAALVYDASFAYEVAVIMEEAVTEMLGPEPQDRFWYLTLYNETYPMPAAARGGRRGGRPPGASSTGSTASPRRPARATARATCGRRSASPDPCGGSPWRRSASWPSATAWPPTPGPSRRGRTCAPTPSRSSAGTASTPRREPRAAVVTDGARAAGPTPWSPSPTTCAACPTRWRASSTGPTRSLGTDGFGRSDAREALRSYFEVDAAHLVVAVLQQLALRRPDRRPRSWPGRIADLGIDAGGDAPFIV